MLTVRKKYGLVLGSVFILSLITFNILLNKFFDKNFKKFVAKDMEDIYKISSKNLEDYTVLNSIDKNKMNIEDFNSKAMSFIVERVNSQGIFYNINGEVISNGINNGESIDLNIIKDLPPSFENTKYNKTVVDIINKNRNVLGKLSIPIYNEESQIGVLVLVKDYSNDYLRNLNIKSIINIMVSILFIIIFICIYLLSSSIIKPIIKLKDKLLEISNGDYPEKIKNTSKDEIGVLINSFNDMNEKLKFKDNQEKNIFRNITHELKTPLTNISGYAQILIEDDFNDEAFKKKALERIISESNRMHELVMSLLNISKQSSDLEEYSFEEVNIKNIIDDLISLKSLQIKEKELNIITNIEEVNIRGNKQYLIILFSNLIDNGIKYSYKKTNIIIEVKKDNNNLYFSILSKGKKIPYELKDKIFEPFVKVEEKGFSSKNSNGLGLYICRNIVLGHKGKINLILDDDKSKFIIELPKNLQVGNKLEQV